ncbi:MAG: hypothetical protein QM775_14145 [Pirellulales bacterium]
MGIFDFFRSKPEPPPRRHRSPQPFVALPPEPGASKFQKPAVPQTDEDAEFAALLDADGGPSFEYALAHLALRGVALEEPLGFLGVVASPDAEKFLTSIITRVAETCKCRPPFGAKQIRVHKMRVKNYPCAILEFPPPRETTEAFMVACVVPMNPQQDLREGEAVKGRYFTLEKGYVLPGDPPRTVLAEWDEHAHSNYGDGPPAEPRAFAAALEKLL